MLNALTRRLPFVSALSSSDEKKERNYITESISTAILVAIVVTWWPEVIPFEVFGAPFWGRDTSVWAAMQQVWFIFAWAFGVNFIVQLAENVSAGSGINRFLRRKEELSSGQILGFGTIRSFIAGTTEELAFRWILFLGAIPGVLVANWFMGGFLGIIAGLLIAVLAFKLFEEWEWVAITLAGAIMVCFVVLALGGWLVDPVKWVYGVLLVPLADFMTMGYLHDILYHPHSWAIGAAVLSTNAFFRDGHKYQGLFGVINAWFGGMLFFWMLFEYGLVACMVVHFLYDVVCYATVAFMRLFR